MYFKFRKYFFTTNCTNFTNFGCALLFIYSNFTNEIASDFLPAAANSFNSLNYCEHSWVFDKSRSRYNNLFNLLNLWSL